MRKYPSQATKDWKNSAILLTRADQSFFAKPSGSDRYNKLILECGCGTGQRQFLQLNNNHTLGVDAVGLVRVEHKTKPAGTVRVRPDEHIQSRDYDESFDVVISHGVLHHTYDARAARADREKAETGRHRGRWPLHSLRT